MLCSMEQSHWELNRFSDSQEITAFYGTPRVCTAFTRARSIQSIPSQPTSWWFMLILLSYLWLGFPSGLFPSGFLTKTLCAHLLSHIRATCRAHHILLDWITRNIWWGVHTKHINTLCGNSGSVFIVKPYDVSTTGPCKWPCVLNLVICMKEERELRVCEREQCAELGEWK
jgi:hypothetical protein